MKTRKPYATKVILCRVSYCRTLWTVACVTRFRFLRENWKGKRGIKTEFILFAFHSFCSSCATSVFLGLHKSVAIHRKTSMRLQTIYVKIACILYKTFDADFFEYPASKWRAVRYSRWKSIVYLLLHKSIFYILPHWVQSVCSSLFHFYSNCGIFCQRTFVTSLCF